MTLPFLRRKDSGNHKGLRERAMLVRSAEVAWPIRGDGRTREENLALLERSRRRRAGGSSA